LGSHFDCDHGFWVLGREVRPVLEFASKSLAARLPSVGGQLVGNIAGLLLIALGGAIMVLAIIRFRHTALDIDSAETRPGILAALLVILGAALFVYLSYTLISRM
jgi:uncharacterized membrane protein YidH (DUF202 family)